LNENAEVDVFVEIYSVILFELLIVEVSPLESMKIM
jgi:hypothetical protein